MYLNSYVTFGDGDKIKIIERGKLESLGLPCLNNVLLIVSLTANLISKL